MEKLIIKILPRKSPFLDWFVITSILLATNLLLQREDLGWFQSNPSPYLLIPLLLGCRYGFIPGTQGALATICLLAVLDWYNIEIYLEDFLVERKYLVFSFLVVGGLSGEIQSYHRRKYERAEVIEKETKDKMKTLDEDLKHTFRVNDQLQRQLVTLYYQVASLDYEIRSLYECPKLELYQNVLFILNRVERVSNSAIYVSNPKNPEELRRTALIGDDDYFPKRMNLNDRLITKLAWENKEMVVLPETIARDYPQDDPYLLVIPILGHSEHPLGLIIIAGMPFINYTPHNLKRMRSIIGWASEVIVLRQSSTNSEFYRVISGSDTKKIFYSEFLWRQLARAIDSYRSHHIESSILLIYTTGYEDLPVHDFEDTMMEMVRDGDYAVHLPEPHPNLCLFLPFAGSRGCSLFIGRCEKLFSRRFPDLKPLKSKIFSIKEFEGPQDVFEVMVDPFDD